MTKINYFSHKMLAGAVALAMVTLATSAIADSVPQFVTVINLTGQARYSVDNNKTWKPLHNGDVLQSGSVIQTAEKSQVDVVMGEAQGGDVFTASRPKPVSVGGSGGAGGGGGGEADNGPKSNIVRIQASSVLAIDKLTLEKTGMDEVSETQLDLRAGQIMGNVKKLSAASRYEVKIPNGVAGIRGTSYVINSDGSLFVLSGQVILTYVGAGGALVTQTVSGGQSFVPPTVPGGTGTVGNIPADKLADLIANTPTGPTTGTPPPLVAPNGTLIHISPE
jgi:hypothetical protein